MQTRDSIQNIWGPRAPYVGPRRWPERLDERSDDEAERWVQSCCVLCSNGCGLDIGVTGGRIVGVRGRAEDHVNRGRLGPKGLNGWVANNAPDRLTRPQVRRDGELVEASWDEAMGLIVENARRTIERQTAGGIGIYSTGQLFLEEYYTLAVLGKAGLGTPHMDGNTRLCTATAARALLESFGVDGQPSSYEDYDQADTILLAGHNAASQQTVLWMRLLDRLAGPEPPKLVVIDPRVTETARHATVHLAPRVGTNVAVMNGLIRLIIEAGHIDRDFIDRHTMGFDQLREGVEPDTPDRVEQITGIPADTLRRAADVLGTAERLMSGVLQGFYQSNQASAAAVQVNNMQLIRGMIGKPGCGVLQMNGQPTAQNTRECGADGEMPGFRNWGNVEHIAELARLWNVHIDTIPHWAPPTHAMQIFRYAEQGSISFLWVIATNPAVSMPDLPRIREILGKEGLFLVVQDAFPTETTRYADVVLPAALWGEKTGAFTNTDRTVHLSLKAVEPPGEARSDLDIFLDFARRMDFRDQDGKPLIKWSDPEGAFDAWRACSKGRPCDYSGVSYETLRDSSGIRWPVTEEHPEGAPRLYADHTFGTDPDYCGSFGHDLVTGAAYTEQEYRSRDPKGRAILKAAAYQPPPEVPDVDYPMMLTTGRVVYHFHTRTKTGRSKALHDAAPDAFVQMNAGDAARLGIAEGDLVEVETRRGTVRAPAQLGDILPDHLFLPFHYGALNSPDRPTAANELTLPTWDPASKQPHFKYAAARLSKVGTLDKAKDAAGAAVGVVRSVAGAVASAVPTPGSGSKAAPSDRKLGDYIGMVLTSEEALAEAFERVGGRHDIEPGMKTLCDLLASWSRSHVEALGPVVERYSSRREAEPRRLADALFRGDRSGGLGLLRDLHDLWLLANESHVSWEVLRQVSLGLRDEELKAICGRCGAQNDRQIAWLRTRIDQVAPQALIVPS
ncbi:molybdopterin oxidoreductase family protein [Tautonia plasticadhaerens]|uniref:Nitrate reductase n=1 Tax=Tautonia plasticadhaerens TaxID=2527974 RepID=A0A518H0Q3_9BACT|nr:nitrate reductase [Tautonia plasticadhaerens]QDV34401.1 Nitrate reductase [Tautonia plasticadhaerens]